MIEKRESRSRLERGVEEQIDVEMGGLA